MTAHHLESVELAYLETANTLESPELRQRVIDALSAPPLLLPDLRGMTLDEALRALQEVGFEPVAVSSQVTPTAVGSQTLEAATVSGNAGDGGALRAATVPTEVGQSDLQPTRASSEGGNLQPVRVTSELNPTTVSEHDVDAEQRRRATVAGQLEAADAATTLQAARSTMTFEVPYDRLFDRVVELVEAYSFSQPQEGAAGQATASRFSVRFDREAGTITAHHVDTLVVFILRPLETTSSRITYVMPESTSTSTTGAELGRRLMVSIVQGLAASFGGGG